ncbi:MAG TPA: hypothetical protein VLT36_20270, partial [Candidatus Dormibacteraeota bacterium]|nr:hypothetical protein [Candidatus Dormibacteraeota bacterium]
MTRKAIIIAVGEPKPSSKAHLDTDLWHSFLSSTLGGAWEVNEIIRVLGDRREPVLDAVGDAKGADYSLVVFIGPGEVVKRELPWAEGEV